MSIYIFSRPIHNGKTTALLHWCNRHENVYGVLMPDINGCRKILVMPTEDIFDIECSDVNNTDALLTTVGKFHFYTAAFEKSNLIISASLKQNPAWLVIDEAGKLELEGKGFYPGLKDAVEFYSHDKNPGNLLITVRDSLCEAVIQFFNLNACNVINSLDDLI